jgi:hypothetical protein
MSQPSALPTMWRHHKDVAPVRVQVRSLDQLCREVVCTVLPPPQPARHTVQAHAGREAYHQIVCMQMQLQVLHLYAYSFLAAAPASAAVTALAASCEAMRGWVQTPAICTVTGVCITDDHLDVPAVTHHLKCLGHVAFLAAHLPGPTLIYSVHLQPQQHVNVCLSDTMLHNTTPQLTWVPATWGQAHTLT